MADAEATTALYLAKRKDAISPLVAAFVEVAAEASRHSRAGGNP
jgi:hypothetical protein